MPPVRARTWCFTINNYTEEQQQQISQRQDKYKYLIYGKEVGEQNTPHLQGLVTYKNPCTLTSAKRNLINTGHFTIARNIPRAIEYCKKDGDYVEFGQAPQQGKRTDLDEFLDALKEDPKRALTDVSFRIEHATVFAKYHTFAEDIIERLQPKREIEAFPLRPWQQELNQILNGPIDKRKIIFVVDLQGNKGKTWYCHYYQSLHDNVDILVPAKKADMAYKLIHHPRVVFFDAPRSKSEHLQFDFFEEVKNGYVFSPKYNSKIKSFTPPHVVVMMNEHPDPTKLSQDRYQTIVI